MEAGAQIKAEQQAAYRQGEQGSVFPSCTRTDQDCEKNGKGEHDHAALVVEHDTHSGSVVSIDVCGYGRHNALSCHDEVCRRLHGRHTIAYGLHSMCLRSK